MVGSGPLEGFTVFEGVPRVRNIALEVPGLQMRDFMEKSYENDRLLRVPKMRNPAMEAPGLEIRDLIKEKY